MLYFTKQDFESNISFVEDEKKRILIPEQNPSPAAAAIRLDTLDRVLMDLSNTINSDICRPREMPAELIDMYEKVCSDICRIRFAEKSIIRG